MRLGLHLSCDCTCVRSTLRAIMLSLSSSLVFSVVSCSRPIRLILPRLCNLPPLLQGTGEHVLYTHGLPDVLYTHGPPDVLYTHGLPDVLYTHGPPDVLYSHGLPDVLYTHGLPDIKNVANPHSDSHSRSQKTMTNMVLETHTRPNSWLIENMEPSENSFAFLTAGSHNNTCRLILGKATRDCVCV